MKFEMTSPCDNCPFREDKPFHLHPARAREIAAGLRADKTFACHKTIDYGALEDDEDADSEGAEHRTQAGEQHCAGASIMLEREGRPNQMMRWMARLGAYDPTKLKMDAPVYATFEKFIAAMKKLDRRGQGTK